MGVYLNVCVSLEVYGYGGGFGFGDGGFFQDGTGTF